jgi:hypothetical protein
MALTLSGPAGKKIIAGGITLGVMQAIAMAAMGFDDDEPPEFVKERNFLIPYDGEHYISIPYPLGFHVLPNIGRITAEWVMGGFELPVKKFGNILSVMAEAFNPLGSSGVSLQTIMPTPLDPFVALAENKDWTGKPIYREDFSSLAPSPGFKRTKDTATAYSKLFAWGFNRITGGTNADPGMFSPTPDQIDYLFGQATGGVGREATKLWEFGQSKWTGEELPSYKIPLVGRFYGSTEGQAQEATKFYNNIRQMHIYETELKDRRKERKPVNSFLKSHPEAIYWQEANRLERVAARLNERKHELKRRNASKAAIDTINKTLTLHMKRFNDLVEKKK